MVWLVVRSAVAAPGTGRVELLGGHHIVVLDRKAYSYIFSRSSSGSRWRVLGSGCCESDCSISLIVVSSSDDVEVLTEADDDVEVDEYEVAMRTDLR